MGGLAVDGKSRAEVVEALDALYGEAEFVVDPRDGPEVEGDERALIISGSKGWTAVYLERFDQDEAVAAALAKTLSAAVLVHRAELYEAFSIAVFLDGELVDRYASASGEEAFFDDELDELGFEDGAPQDPDFEGDGGGDPGRIAALVPRVDAAALGAIYQRCRSEPGAGPADEAVIAGALKELRSVLGLGTLEHDFLGLWNDAERLGLKATFRGWSAPKRRLRDVWAGWRLKAERSRDSLLAPARRVRDRIRGVKPDKTGEAEAADSAVAEASAGASKPPAVEAPAPRASEPSAPSAPTDMGPGLRASDDEPIPPEDH